MSSMAPHIGARHSTKPSGSDHQPIIRTARSYVTERPSVPPCPNPDGAWLLPAPVRLSGPLVLAHRGCPTPDRPENTVGAVAAALAAGADGAEVDVRLTADGTLICSHDADLSRLAGRSLRVTRTAAADLRRVPLAGGHHLATLEEILSAARQHGRRRVVVEAKPVANVGSALRTAQTLSQVIADFDTALDITVSSFDRALLSAVRRALGGVTAKTALLGSPGIPVRTLLRQAVRAGHDEIHPNGLAVLQHPDLVDAAHRLGMGVTCWTVNDPRHVVGLVALGVNGMITDDPTGVRTTMSRTGGGRDVPAATAAACPV